MAKIDIIVAAPAAGKSVFKQYIGEIANDHSVEIFETDDVMEVTLQGYNKQWHTHFNGWDIMQFLEHDAAYQAGNDISLARAYRKTDKAKRMYDIFQAISKTISFSIEKFAGDAMILTHTPAYLIELLRSTNLGNDMHQIHVHFLTMSEGVFQHAIDARIVNNIAKKPPVKGLLDYEMLPSFRNLMKYYRLEHTFYSGMMSDYSDYPIEKIVWKQLPAGYYVLNYFHDHANDFITNLPCPVLV